MDMVEDESNPYKYVKYDYGLIVTRARVLEGQFLLDSWDGYIDTS